MIFNRLIVSISVKIRSKEMFHCVHEQELAFRNINCSKPTVLSEIVFPPALGPEITMILFLDPAQ
jgi:hypothetical protein